MGIENLLNEEEKTNFNIDSLVEVKEDLAFDIDPVGEITIDKSLTRDKLRDCRDFVTIR